MALDDSNLKTETDSAGHKFRLLGEISRGGQGAVFRTQYPDYIVKLDLVNGKPVSSSEQRRLEIEALRFLPIPSGLHVTMPLAVLTNVSGYVMQLMGDMISFSKAFDPGDENQKAFTSEENPWLSGMEDYRSLFTVMIRRGGLRRLLHAYLKAAVIMARLHGAGLVYCDFSPNNVFISSDPNYCHVWIIDTDNLEFQQELRGAPAVYTPGIGAPEIANRKSGNTFAADAYAFSASLFEQLFLHRPFEGQQYEDYINEEGLEEAEEALTLGDFDWILQEDGENIWPTGELLCNILLSSDLFALFEGTFCDGKLKPAKRPSMMELSYGIAKSLDKVVHCPKCQMDFDFKGDCHCAWCDEGQTVLTVTSYTEEGNEIWSFAREVAREQKEIMVPARIVHGFRSEEIEKDAFQVNWTKQGLLVKFTGAIAYSELSFSAGGRSPKNTNTFETKEHQCQAVLVDDNGCSCRIIFALEGDNNDNA